MASSGPISTSADLRQLLLEQVLLDRMAWQEPILGQPDFGASLVVALTDSLVEWVRHGDYLPVNLVDLIRLYRQRLDGRQHSPQLQLGIEDAKDNPHLPARMECAEITLDRQQRRFGWWADARTDFRARREVTTMLLIERYPDLRRALGEDSSLVVFRRVARPDTWFSAQCAAIPPELIGVLSEVSDRQLRTRRKKAHLLPDGVGQIEVHSVSGTLRRLLVSLRLEVCVPLWEIHYPTNPRPLLDV